MIVTATVHGYRVDNVHMLFASFPKIVVLS